MGKFLLLLIAFLVMKYEHAMSASIASSENSDVSTSSLSIKPSKKEEWNYIGVKDEMRNKTSYIAKINSKNQIYIGSIYGNVGLNLILGGQEEYGFPMALFTLTNGQFAECGSTGCEINYKIDSGKILTISSRQMDSGNLIGCSEHMVEKLGINGCMVENLALFYEAINGKKMIIEVDILNYGRAQFSFDVSGLQPLDKWSELATIYKK